MKRIVYTAITNNKDGLKENQRTDGAHFVAFLDQSARSSVWEIRRAHDGFDDPSRNAKIHKILAHHYFPNTEYSLWMDGAVSLRVPLRVLIDTYLTSSDLAVFRHPGEHDCLYREAGICKQFGLDDPKVIDKQVQRYRQAGYPEKFGLAECTVLLRRHTKKVAKFNELWWEEIKHGSKRDQLSFNYVVWKVGLKCNYFPGQVQDDPKDPRKNGNPYFGWSKHNYWP